MIVTGTTKSGAVPAVSEKYEEDGSPCNNNNDNSDSDNSSSGGSCLTYLDITYLLVFKLVCGFLKQEKVVAIVTDTL